MRFICPIVRYTQSFKSCIKKTQFPASIHHEISLNPTDIGRKTKFKLPQAYFEPAKLSGARTVLLSLNPWSANKKRSIRSVRVLITVFFHATDTKAVIHVAVCPSIVHVRGTCDLENDSVIGPSFYPPCHCGALCQRSFLDTGYVPWLSFHRRIERSSVLNGIFITQPTTPDCLRSIPQLIGKATAAYSRRAVMNISDLLGQL